MARDGSGVYHRPVGTDAVTDTTIESTKYNVNVADVEQDLNLPRPIVAGGTGATTPDSALQALSAEKAKQIVTNYDSQVWLPGSFYSATTALGTVPVAVHAFAGIAYYANASDFVLEATDLTDANNATYRRVMTAGVWGPWVLTSSAGGSSTATSVGEYTFSTAITFPPATGEIRFNNATQNSTTEVFLSHLTAGGADVTHMIPFDVRNGVELNVQDKVDVTKWKVFTVTADPVLSGGDYRFTVTLKNSANDLLPQRVLVGTAAGGAVRYDIAQNLTAAQKSQGRANIDIPKFNYIVNGAMMISQQWGATVLTMGSGAVQYPIDQFYVYANTTAVATAVQLYNFTSPAGSPTRLRVVVGTADASVGAGDLAFIGQRIEGHRIIDLRFGSANAKTIILQFGCKGPAGTYGLSLRNNDFNRSYIGEYVIAAGEANTDVIKRVTIPGDVIGTWMYGNNIGYDLTWCLMGGLNYQTPPNVWSSSNFLTSANQFNFMGTAGNTFELFDVGLYEGTAAPAFQVPYLATELEVCRRYCETFTLTLLSPVAGTLVVPYSFKTLKRAAPTMTTIAGPTVSAATASFNLITVDQVGLSLVTTAVNSYAANWGIMADARI